MRIKEIEMTNFKQYYGTQSITFAGGDEDDPTNVTVVYGKNGRGKTTLYRALLFGLYGDVVLDQDYNYDKSAKADSSIYIGNLLALDEDSQAENKGIEAKVKIVFMHDGQEYEIIRSVKSIQDNKGNIHEESPTVKFIIKDHNTKVLDNGDKEEIQASINKILNEKVKDYFLFDGERIERLTKASSEQKREVAKGIRNLLKIDDLFIVQDALKQLCSIINKDLQKISTGDYLKKLKEIESLRNKIQTVESKISDLEKELALAERHKIDIEHELEKFNELKDIIEKTRRLEKELEDSQTLKQGLLSNMGKFTRAASVLLAKDLVQETITYIDNKRSKGEVPSEIKKELIERLLKEMSCICGREIKLGSDEYERLSEWNRQSNTQAFEQYMMSFFGDLKQSTQYIEDRSADLIDLLTQFGSADEKIDTISGQLQNVKEEAGEVPDYDFAAKNKYRDELLSKIATIKHNIELEQIHLGDTKELLKACQLELGKLEGDVHIQSNLGQKLKITEDSLAALLNITDGFIKEIKQELEDKANILLKKLIDAEGAQNLRKIIVKDDYTLEILDWKDRPFLANISAGQRQVVSLSFITALAQVAGGTTILEMPLFMDTPFGRLHGEHRDNLLELIPGMTPQWVLLATGTEFTGVEAEKLRNTGKWGKYYMLEPQGQGVTLIKEEKPERFKPIR